MPVIAFNILQSIKLLADSCESFSEHCVEGITANENNIKKHLENSLMLVTSLNPVIGYDNAPKLQKESSQRK